MNIDQVVDYIFLGTEINENEEWTDDSNKP